MLNGTREWYRPGGRKTGEDIREWYRVFILRGLAAPEPV
jgi:Tetracyclin repressor-like, C-terminal domain